MHFKHFDAVEKSYRSKILDFVVFFPPELTSADWCCYKATKS